MRMDPINLYIESRYQVLKTMLEEYFCCFEGNAVNNLSKMEVFKCLQNYRRYRKLTYTPSIYLFIFNLTPFILDNKILEFSLSKTLGFHFLIGNKPQV